MDREDTCHRTCFSLQLNGNTLDNFAELKNIDGLKEGSTIKVLDILGMPTKENELVLNYSVKVAEEPYTMREARIHLRHVRDLLKSLDPSDAYNGIDCSSLSFLNVVTQGDILGKHSCMLFNQQSLILFHNFFSCLPCVNQLVFKVFRILFLQIVFFVDWSQVLKPYFDAA